MTLNTNGTCTFLILRPNSSDKILAACSPVSSSDAISIRLPKNELRRSSTRVENSAIFSRAICCSIVEGGKGNAN